MEAPIFLWMSQGSAWGTFQVAQVVTRYIEVRGAPQRERDQEEQYP